MHPTNIVLLEFDPEHDTLTEEKELRDGISVALRMGRTLWLANDESVTLERLTLSEPASTGRSSFTGEHQQFALHDFLPLPLPPHGETPDDINEADIEGLACDSKYMWLTGSHSLRRKQPRADDSAKKARKRLGTVSADGNRCLLARIPITEQDGQFTLLKDIEHKGKRRSAAMLVCSNTARAQSTRPSATTGWVPHRARAMPSAPAYPGVMANGVAWLHQPARGWEKRAWCRAGTQMKAGAPGPALRYL